MNSNFLETFLDSWLFPAAALIVLITYCWYEIRQERKRSNTWHFVAVGVVKEIKTRQKTFRQRSGAMVHRNLAKLPKRCAKHNKTLKCMVSEVCYSAYECRASSKDYCMFEVVPEKIELWEINRKRL